MEKIESKVCSKCREIKPLTEFHKDNGIKDGHSSWCKKCTRENRIKYQKTPRGKFTARKAQLKSKFNMTPADYDKIYMDQLGLCAICGTHQSDLKKSLAVDHNHETGKIRGLLCNRCNIGIMNLKEDAENCLNAYSYLRERS